MLFLNLTKAFAKSDGGRVYIHWVDNHKDYNRIKILIDYKIIGESITYAAYIKANIRLEELLKEVGNDTLEDSPQMIELLKVNDIIEQYVENLFPIGLPTL